MKKTKPDWKALCEKILAECDTSGPARCQEHYTAKLRRIEELVREALKA